MNELIRIEERDGREVVDARELHEALGVGKVFAAWITERIEKYGFLEGKDYETCFPNLESESRGGQNRKEYFLTVAMAKELATVENNDKGREVRRYLIKVEEAWNSPELVMARALQAASRTIETYRERLVSAESRIDRLVHNNRTYTVGELAKELGFRSAQELNQDLKDRGIQYKDGRGVWLLYSEYADKGFTRIKQMEHSGVPRYYMQWTGIGRDWLLGLYASKRIEDKEEGNA